MFVPKVNLSFANTNLISPNFNGKKPKSPKIVEEKIQQAVKKGEEFVKNEVLQPAPKPKKHWWEFNSDDDGSTSDKCIDELIRDL